MPGTVITFYSYKGGVGRTQALANVATLLASWGYRVLCVDWDLEAPGVHLYFKEWRKPRPGLIAMLDERVDWKSCVERVEIRPRSAMSQSVSLSIIAAGSDNGHYLERVQRLNWAELYERHGLGEQIEAWRDAWKTSYDFILVDSRTGISDTGGICTVHLPDQLVLLSTANWQSLDGVVDVATRAVKRHSELPYDRAGLPCIPVVTRFDSRVEGALAARWLEQFAVSFEPLYRRWVHKEATARALLDFLRIPYVARYSFGEDLAVVDEGTSSPENLGYAFETLAAVLANGLADTDVLMSRRDAYVASARARGPEHYDYDVFLSAQHWNRELSQRVTARLSEADIKVASWHQFPPDHRADNAQMQIMGRSRHFVFLVGKYAQHSRWLDVELETALRYLSTDAQHERRIVPVLVEGATPRDLPHALASFQAISLKSDQGWEELIRALTGRQAASGPDGDDYDQWPSDVDGVTGALTVPPSYSSLVARSRDGEMKAQDQRRRALALTTDSLGIIEPIDDPDDLAQVGWGVVWTDSVSTEIKAALTPLLQLRRREAGELFRELDAGGARTLLDLQEQWGFAPGAIRPSVVPKYLLIVGSPADLSFELQHELALDFFVGRLDLGDAGEVAYASYANAVANAGPQIWKTFAALICPPSLRRYGLVDSLRQMIAERDLAEQFPPNSPDMKPSLVRALAGGRMRLLFAAGQGVVMPAGSLSQRHDQGALVTEDWRGPARPFTRDAYFAATDVPADADLRGAACILHAGYSGGVPRRSRFGSPADPDQTAVEFTAALPSSLLAHGAAAVLARTDRSWDLGEWLFDTWAAIVAAILRGRRVGRAASMLHQRYIAETADLGEALRRRDDEGLPISDGALLSLWRHHAELYGWALFGDPAARVGVE